MEKSLYVFKIHAFPNTRDDLTDFQLVFIIRRTDLQKVDGISPLYHPNASAMRRR